LVADCVMAMKAEVALPVTVKTRIGIDDRDSYRELVDFVGQVAEAGCDALVVHARKAWLQGLSPRENREIPPLRYDVVLALKRDFPRLPIAINGGIQTLGAAVGFLAELDGVMIGREAYQNPWMLAQADRLIFGDLSHAPTRHQVLTDYVAYVERQLAAGVPLGAMTRHVLGLYQGRPGARAWRRYISERAHLPGAGAEILTAVLPSERDIGRPEIPHLPEGIAPEPIEWS
jgi:tRNA-dihydrouridine synthase A